MEIAGDLRAVFYLKGETVWSVDIGDHSILSRVGRGSAPARREATWLHAAPILPPLPGCEPFWDFDPAVFAANRGSTAG